jgi:N-acetylmuramoyl-L-alanine amidase
MRKNHLHINAPPNTSAHDSPVRQSRVELRRFPIFGAAYEMVEMLDNRLDGTVFYLVSGHGGPDSGARGERDGQILCEDEYAYDIGLRIARLLLQHDARVHIIVRDADDGIRDEAFLQCDEDEYVLGGHAIPVDQSKRLRQRANIINNLHKRNKEARYARVIELHVDSRESGNRIDVYFYHHSGSADGARTAETLRRTIWEKYATYQPWRGYRGTVSARDGLYMLRAVLPVTVYIELGNIRSEWDQRRLIIPENRQYLAEWIVEGLLADVEAQK